MNNKGFTFVELIAIIVIIAVITIIAVPSINRADEKINQEMYDTKIKLIKSAAKEYGEDYMDVIVNVADPNDDSTWYHESENKYPKIEITVEDLYNNGYLVKDSGSNEEDIKDPRDDSSMFDIPITIYIKNNQPYCIINN